MAPAATGPPPGIKSSQAGIHSAQPIKACSAGDNTDQWGKSSSALITPGNSSTDDDVLNLV